MQCTFQPFVSFSVFVVLHYRKSASLTFQGDSSMKSEDALELIS
jgi:hypothetical protein